MIKLRYFTEEGLTEFNSFLLTLKEGKYRNKPDLNINQYSEQFFPPAEIDEKIIIRSRLELAKNLRDIFSDIKLGRTDILKNENLWNWISYIWIEQLTNDLREIRETARYILTPGKNNRHIVFSSYDIITLCGDKLSQLFLYTPLHKESEFINNFVGKHRWISSITLIEILYELYYDKINKKPKQGCAHKGTPGNIYRLIKVLGQIEMNYDIYSMEVSKIMSFLPGEFDKWKTGNW